MKIRQLLRPGTGVLVALLLLAGCGSAGAAQGQQAAAATAAPAAETVRIPDALLGTWKADVIGTSASSGTWTLRITADDMELLNPIATSEDEYFSINPKTISDTGLTLWEEPDCDAAEYEWSIDGGSLTFEAVKDECIDRPAVLTTTAWQRSP